MATVRDVSGNSPVTGVEPRIFARNDVSSGKPELAVDATDFSFVCRAINASAAETVTLLLDDGTSLANYALVAGMNPVRAKQVVSRAGSAVLHAIF